MTSTATRSRKASTPAIPHFRMTAATTPLPIICRQRSSFQTHTVHCPDGSVSRGCYRSRRPSSDLRCRCASNWALEAQRGVREPELAIEGVSVGSDHGSRQFQHPASRPPCKLIPRIDQQPADTGTPALVSHHQCRHACYRLRNLQHYGEMQGNQSDSYSVLNGNQYGINARASEKGQSILNCPHIEGVTELAKQVPYGLCIVRVCLPDNDHSSTNGPKTSSGLGLITTDGLGLYGAKQDIRDGEKLTISATKLLADVDRWRTGRCFRCYAVADPATTLTARCWISARKLVTDSVFNLRRGGHCRLPRDWD